VPESVVLLHGFSATSRAWDRVAARLDRERYLPLAIDLPGHGTQADARPPITFEGCVRHVLERAPERFVLCGYSLGGRVALHVALAAPERVSRLVLVSASAGIEGPREREQRRAADERLARELEEGDFEQFIERWRSQALFAGEPEDVGALAREDQRRNRPAALAAVLRGIGSGQMRPLWAELPELAMPLDVVVGKRDERYCELGARIAGLVAGARLVELGGGHVLPLEAPGELAAVLASSR
jgi:2-succinyl-6-hydroxy-2,4-cyclohexadiene-1-carboxylate synthase